MSEIQEKIIFTTDDNEEVEFFVLEQTKINGVNYILVADASDEEEANALILKENSEDENEEITYDVLEDDAELRAISKVFEQIMDDIEFELEK